MDRDRLLLIPSLEAAALRIRGALTEQGRELSQRAEALSDADNLAEFIARLARVRWKRFWQSCVETADDPGTRPPQGDEPGAEWEREARNQRLKALAIPWSDLTLPLAVSARVVAHIAQKLGTSSSEVRDADELSAAIARHILLSPVDEVMELADRVERLVDRMSRQLGEGDDTVTEPGPTSPRSGGSSRLSVPERVLLVVNRLIKERRFDATQGEVAEMAGCSPRSLRRGKGRDYWRFYEQAGVQGAAPTRTDNRSRQEKLRAEKAAQKKREEEKASRFWRS